ncbi:unnamed protein product [Thelazia callipaeda]|uniref:Sema domain-containing protein n=1 Tax=Thelazia callipaeda TaxID=103827 RepID=A0A0N5CTV3_THECL|nr:unnamed protein product [Thelazia callipaeda]
MPQQARYSSGCDAGDDKYASGLELILFGATAKGQVCTAVSSRFQHLLSQQKIVSDSTDGNGSNNNRSIS